jgi:queuosine precursor transporter
MKFSILNKENFLFLLLGFIFITNALIAEFIGVKIFSLEKWLGMEPFQWKMLGIEDLSFNLTAGVLLWPIVFVMTDIINEYYGIRGVRLLTHVAIAMIGYSFLMFYFAIGLPPADFWPQSHIHANQSPELQMEIASKVGDYNYAYRLIFGQGLWIIVGSLVAFLVGQILDVFVFQSIKRMTGDKWVWLRATGSTLVSQFVDSFVVLFIAFYVGADWKLSLVLAIGLVNYIYKFIMAVLLTPLIYLGHFVIDRYLGPSLAQELKDRASAG